MGKAPDGMRRCTCGCDEFEVDCIEQAWWRITINENGEIEELIDREGYASDFTGNFVCCNCGKEYADIDDIPIFSTEENSVCQI